MVTKVQTWGVLSLSCDCGPPLPPYPQIVAAMWLWSSPVPLPSNCRYHMTVVIPFSSVPHSKKLSTIHTCCTFGLTLKTINPLTNRWCLLVSSDFGRMLSDSTIHFEDRFCASRKGGTRGGGRVHRSAWQGMVAVAAACRKPWSMTGGPFVCFLAQTGVENAPFTL